MFAEAAAAMHKRSAADGEAVRTGGPVVSQLSQAPAWIPALLKNSSAGSHYCVYKLLFASREYLDLQASGPMPPLFHPQVQIRPDATAF
jgi:hypothetical protein